MICFLKVSHSLLSHVRDHISAIWHGDVLARATLFHCPHHTVSYYFPHSFCTFFFFLRKRLSSAQSDSPPACRLTFPVKELYCWFSVPLHPLHKTVVSIAFIEYIHKSQRHRLAGPISHPPILPCRLTRQSGQPSVSYWYPTPPYPLKLLGYRFSCSMRTLIIAAPPPCKCTNNWLSIYFPGETGEQTGGFNTPHLTPF